MWAPAYWTTPYWSGYYWTPTGATVIPDAARIGAVQLDIHRITKVRQGDSLTFEFDLGGLSLNGWTCIVEVMEFPGDTALISKTISRNNERAWNGALSTLETADLPSGITYRMYAHQTSSLGDSRTILRRFTVTEAAIN